MGVADYPPHSRFYESVVDLVDHRVGDPRMDRRRSIDVF